MAAEIRRHGIPAEVELAARKLSKALEHADSIGVGSVVLVGPREFSSGTVLLKDMKSGKQETVEVGRLVKRLKAMS
jgi:histidyl-tRNA synthetase